MVARLVLGKGKQQYYFFFQDHPTQPWQKSFDGGNISVNHSHRKTFNFWYFETDFLWENAANCTILPHLAQPNYFPLMTFFNVRFVQSQNDILFCKRSWKGFYSIYCATIGPRQKNEKCASNFFLEIMRWFTTLKVTRIDDGITGAIS